MFLQWLHGEQSPEETAGRESVPSMNPRLFLTLGATMIAQLHV